MTRTCRCGKPIEGRAGKLTCSQACRKAKSRDEGYVVTLEDREAIDRVVASCPYLMATRPISAEEYRAHLTLQNERWQHSRRSET